MHVTWRSYISDSDDAKLKATKLKATKQEAWREAKKHQLDEFIAKVSATFPGAIEYVVVESPDKVVWCKTGEDDV